MFFNPIKKINRFLNKGMSNIYLKVTNEKKWRTQNFDCLSLKYSPHSSSGEIQLTKISLNYENFCCNLKIRRLKSKLYVVFLLFLFWKELWRFKAEGSLCFIEQKYKLLIKTRQNQKWKIPHTVLDRWTLCFNSYKNFELKVMCWSAKSWGLRKIK